MYLSNVFAYKVGCNLFEGITVVFLLYIFETRYGIGFTICTPIVYFKLFIFLPEIVLY